MNHGILKRLAAAIIAMLMLVTLASSIGQAESDFDDDFGADDEFNIDDEFDIDDDDDEVDEIIAITYSPNTEFYQEPVTETAMKGVSYYVRGGMFSNPGFIFNGWNTHQHGNGINYLSKYHIFTSNTILYAQWKPNKQRTVAITYKPNYPRGPSNVIDKPVKNSRYEIRYVPFIAMPFGYIFNGWNTRADGRGTLYTPGQVIKAAKNLTLYARWRW